MTQPRLRVLILGGYGFFGGNLVRLLADEPRLTLIVAGRSLTKAQDFCRRVPTKGETIPAAIDRDGDIEASLRTLAPHIVVDASGPFQSYGEKGDADPLSRDPRGDRPLARTTWISPMPRPSSRASARSIRPPRTKASSCFPGVSSFPVLTAAVVRRLAQGMEQVESITGGIAPSPYADVGLNVLQAIAGYAGQPVKLTRNGQPALGYGLTESLRFTICPPGCMPLRNTRFSLVDVPDLQVLPPLVAGRAVGLAGRGASARNPASCVEWPRLARALEGLAVALALGSTVSSRHRLSPLGRASRRHVRARRGRARPIASPSPAPGICWPRARMVP